MLREHPTPSARAAGALVGLAIGDALGMPVHGLSHINVRTYYKGIKEYRDDEQRGGPAGTGTPHTRRVCCLLAGGGPACLADLPAGTADAAVVATVAAAWDDADGWMEALPLAPAARAAARLHGWAIAHLARHDAALFDGAAFWRDLGAAAQRFDADPERCVSRRIAGLAAALDEFPLDLHDRCGGTGAAPDEAVPFALAMLARNPHLVEATLLSAINVGGAAATVGALVGSLLGALHGADAFPPDWRAGAAAQHVAAALAAR